MNMTATSTFNAGELNRRILIQRQAEAQDSHGQVVGAWIDVCSTWARFTPAAAGGTEEQKPDQRSSVQPAVFRIRFRRGIEAKMRVVHDGQPWEVLDVVEVGTRDGLDLKAEGREVMPGGPGSG